MTGPTYTRDEPHRLANEMSAETREKYSERKHPRTYHNRTLQASVQTNQMDVQQRTPGRGPRAR